MRNWFVLFVSGLLLPSGQCKVCNVLDYGAVGDGITLNTNAISKAIDACSAQGEDGQVVLLPAGGVYLSGSIALRSGQQLCVEQGAVLLGSESEEDYPLVEALPSYGVGRDVPSELRYRALVSGENLTAVEITGGGVIDGNGGLWWRKHFANELEYSRPPLVELMYTQGLHVHGITLQNSAFWSLHPYGSEHIHIHDITILAPGYAPNTDGVDVDSCRDVIIENCAFHLGDDGIAIKSGLNEAGRMAAMPSENIIIRNITISPQFDNLSTNGVSIGSEMSGGVRNVSIEDVTISKCESGIYIKSMLGRGGVVEDIYVRNVTMSRTLQAIRLSMNYGYRRGLAEDGSDGPIGDDVNPEEIPHFRDIHFRDIRGDDIAEAGFLWGLKESVIRNVTFANVSINSKLGFQCFQITGSANNVSPSMDACLR